MTTRAKKSYVDAMKDHLAGYRVERLGVNEKGTFNSRGEDLDKEHILPKEYCWLNIHEPYRKEVRHYVEHRKVKLHRYFHHLNSSQAFAFNLFFPFLYEGQATPLMNAMGLPGDVVEWWLEYVPDPGERSNLDAAWRAGSGFFTFCEVKLTESSFGPVEGQERHQKKYDGTYKDVLEGIWEPDTLDRQEVFDDYQIFRNLYHGARIPGGRVVFLLPRTNEKLWNRVTKVREQVNDSFREEVHIVAVENVLDKLARTRDLSPKLSATVEQLREKYLLPPA